MIPVGRVVDDGDVTGCDGAPDELKAIWRVERDPLVVLDLFDDILETERDPADVARAPPSAVVCLRRRELSMDLAVGSRPPLDPSGHLDGEEPLGLVVHSHTKRRLPGDAALAPLVENHRSVLRRRGRHGERLDGGTRSLPRPGQEVRAPDTGGRR